MNEPSTEISHNDSIEAIRESADLHSASVELAEAVRDERLSRVSMLRQLRARFPDRSEDELMEVMHQALEQVLRGSL